MTFSGLIDSVLYDYLGAMTQPIAGHPVARTLRREMSNAVREMLAHLHAGPELIVQGSAGQGRWARIPWVAVFHPQETTSAQRGVYIVYLFASDMSAVHLTLNQGVTDTTPQGLASTRDTVRQKVGALAGFDEGPLAGGTVMVGVSAARPHGYEDGCVFYKTYPRGRVPGDSALERDLGMLVTAYTDYVTGVAPGRRREPPPERSESASTEEVKMPVEEPTTQLPSEELVDALILRARNLNPAGFERLLGRLWERMGYEDVQVTGRTADGGIDGMFRVPLVGVRVVFQAKRYAEGNNISAQRIRELKGAVAGRHDLGMFVTTSSYTPGAREEAQDSGPRIVMVDGKGLADLLVQHRLGIHAIVERADLDERFFSGLEGAVSPVKQLHQGPVDSPQTREGG